MSGEKLKSTKLIGDAGEFYVAFSLARRGVHPAILSSNTSGADILVTDDGENVISIQIKSSSARMLPRVWKVDKKPNPSDNFFFVFLNMYDDESKPIECFIVPSHDVVKYTTWNNVWHNFKITKTMEPDYAERWDLILSNLKSLKI